ncbi:MAG: hypothetical protein ACREIA_23205 [Opitutaceae bacterium]
MTSPNDSSAALDVSTNWIQRGRAAEKHGAQGLADALACYDRAIAVLLNAAAEVSADVGGTGSVRSADDTEIVLPKYAQTHVIRCLDAAAFADPRVRHTLGIAHMNRGNVLQRLADAGAIEEAVRAYDTAIQHLETLDSGSCNLRSYALTTYALQNSIGAAWMNRGHALHRLGDARLGDAAASHRTAIAWLSRLPRDDNPAVVCNLTGAQLNLANVLLDLGGAQRILEARDIARAALLTIAPLEEGPGIFATDLSLRARRSLCDALGQLLALETTPRETQEDIADELGDTVEAGLVLSRNCEQQPQWSALREATLRLFRIGARLYALHQPHFLAEFLLEHLDRPMSFDPADWHAVADEALTLAEERTGRTGLFFLEDAASQRALEVIASIAHARRQLASRRSVATA